MSEESDGSLEEFGDEFDEARARAAIEKRNKENHSLRQRLKELEPLAKRAQEADDAAKTEAQKAAEARTAAEQRAEAAELRLLKRDIAADAGLPASWADRLQGSNEAELVADAKALAKDLAPQPQKASSRPVADLKPGALPSSDGSQLIDGNDWLRERAQRRR